ncbi:MAG: hypothetical protein JO212_03970 [Acetobacteraceae bacterium]|nr:hypothetical protein [Acetobacteraceae bacterium]
MRPAAESDQACFGFRLCRVLHGSQTAGVSGASGPGVATTSRSPHRFFIRMPGGSFVVSSPQAASNWPWERSCAQSPPGVGYIAVFKTSIATGTPISSD